MKQVANDQFEVAYDPTGTKPAAFVSTLKEMGYGATPSKSIGVRRSSESLEIQSQSDKPAYSKGKSGKLVLGLFVTKGHGLGGKGMAPTVVQVTAPDGIEFEATEKTLSKALNDPKTLLSLPFKVGKAAKSGELKVVIKVTFEAKGGAATGAQQVTVKVPVNVN